MVAPQTTFGPHLAVAPDGTFVLVFRVNVLVNTTLCSGNGTAPLPPSVLDTAYIPPWKLRSGNPEQGTSIWIAWAPRMTGPWQVVQTNITGAGTQHKSNPSITFLADGRVLMAYRCVHVRVAALRGPRHLPPRRFLIRAAGTTRQAASFSPLLSQRAMTSAVPT